MTQYEIQHGQIIALFSEVHYENLRTDYSGRFMYGKTCLAFVVADLNTFLIEFGMAAQRKLTELEGDDEDSAEDDQLSNWLAHGVTFCTWDSMAYDKVVYWPNVHVCGTAPSG